MTLVMLYRTEIKSDAVDKMDKIRSGFMKIYQEHGVEVIGQWQEINNPTISFYMARYDDEEDYTNSVLKLHEDQKYRELTAKLNEIRTDFEATRLTPA